MPHHIIPIEHIQRQARAAALVHASPANGCCPYPADSEAERVFKDAFLAKRGAMSVQDQPQPKVVTDWSAA